MVKSFKNCALVEGPRWADAAFYGKWLIAAAKANELWTEVLNNPALKRRVDRLTDDVIPDFNIVSTILISRLERNLVSFVVRLNETEIEAFAMMVGMGFFSLTGQRYQMVIPTRLTLGKVLRSALRLSKTEDDEYVLHPEDIIATLPYAEAVAWENRLSGMNEVHRVADRSLLLDAFSDLPSAVTS
jgi:hypothetical protein